MFLDVLFDICKFNLPLNEYRDEPRIIVHPTYAVVYDDNQGNLVINENLPLKTPHLLVYVIFNDERVNPVYVFENHFDAFLLKKFLDDNLNLYNKKDYVYKISDDSKIVLDADWWTNNTDYLVHSFDVVIEPIIIFKNN